MSDCVGCTAKVERVFMSEVDGRKEDRPEPMVLMAFGMFLKGAVTKLSREEPRFFRSSLAVMFVPNLW